MRARDLRLGQSFIVEKAVTTHEYNVQKGESGIYLGGLIAATAQGYKCISSEATVALRNDNVDVPWSVTYKNTINVGCDPEVMVVDKGVVVPAWKFLPKKKDTREPQVFWDGFQAEFTTWPHTCHELLMNEIRRQLENIHYAALKYSKTARLVPSCVVEVPYEMMQSATDEQAALGCAPSKNVYGTRPLDVNPRLLPLRFAGCHIHHGVGQVSDEEATPIVKGMDALCGVASVALLDGVEDARRREFYGRAGEYRLPPHGIEYRTLSSAVLAHPAVTYLMFDLARFGSAIGVLRKQLWNVSEERIQDIINGCDARGARKLLQENKSTFDTVLKQVYTVTRTRTSARRLILEGANNLLDMGNIEESWSLGVFGSYPTSVSQVVLNG